MCRDNKSLLIRFTLVVLMMVTLSCVYMKMNPPADVEKGPPAPALPAVDNSCWMATASNMLAGAGYGNGTTLQARATNIYNNLIAWQTDAGNPTGKEDSGWTDTALSWWLNSANNTWTSNPYSVVTVYGHKSPRYPWANTNGARFIGNELRRCQFVGLSISWPTDAPGIIGANGHAITGWGDEGGKDDLTGNPFTIRVTDSDTDAGGNVQRYTYDSYTNPNPGGAEEGNGWYFDYSDNHPYIKHIVILSPTDDPSDNIMTQKVIGSYQIHQERDLAASDLHYTVGTDVEILSYLTEIDWDSSDPPAITEADPRRSIDVDWDLSDDPVPNCNWVTIETEFVLPYWNAIEYSDVHFTYPDGIIHRIPRFRWFIETPEFLNADRIENVTGGYVVGSLDIVPLEGSGTAGEAQYRFIHEYSFTQDPELHTLHISGEPGYAVVNLSIGHSYGFIESDDLWSFEDWMTVIDDQFELGDESQKIEISWEGRLPYPEGEVFESKIFDPSGLIVVPQFMQLTVDP
ncbi:MAG: hypothetical protein GQ565_01305 [Candidatus Aegiribacteria sp.]|nr:hypothetical protein [Candidatus Aegiribacteria sp.]